MPFRPDLELPEDGWPDGVDEPEECLEASWWALILLARSQNTDRRRRALDAISRRFWHPAYVRLRAMGLSHHDAEDVTQNFIVDAILDGPLLGRADRDRGSLWAFFLKALTNYALNWLRSRKARKRTPDCGSISLEGVEPIQAPAGEADEPGDELDYQWALSLLKEAFRTVEADCIEADQEVHWLIFRRAMVDPIDTRERPPTYAQLSRELGLDGDRKASNMCITVRRRFEDALRRCLRPSVETDAQVNDEILHLMCVFARNAASMRRDLRGQVTTGQAA